MLTAAAVVAFVAYLVSRDTEQRVSLEFFASAEESGRLHSEAADDLEGVLAVIGVASRPDFEARLDAMVESAERAHALLDVAVAPAVAESYGAMYTASTAWLQGVSNFRTTVVSMLEGEGDESDASRIRRAMDTMRSGDVAYNLFLDTTLDPDADVGAARFEEVRYIRPDVQDPLLYDPLTIAVRIGSAYTLASHRDVSITGQFDPEPVSDRAGIPLLPFTDSVTLNAIVTNAGNEAESGVTVELTLLDATTEVSEVFTQTVADLPSGASSTVSFADLVLVPGSLYQAKLVATVVDDTRTENNTWLMTVIQNEEE
jgi:hypothetical protein